ncbi:HEAT repeat domain-containing protein [Thermodesulfobacteriota bacterium]
MPPDAKQIESLIIELNKAYKALQFYPEGHPALDGAMRRTITFIEEVIGEDDDLTFTISRAGFEYEGEAVLKDSKEYKLLAKEFFIRSISKIILIKGILIEELKSFCKLLSEDPKDLRTSGGIDSMMLDYEIEHIWANEVDYDSLLERKKQKIEEEEEEEAEEFEEGDLEGDEEEPEEEPDDESFEEAVESVEAPDEQDALKALQDVFMSNKELFKMLKALYKETDEDAFVGKLTQILNACHNLNKNNDFKSVAKIALYLFALTKPAADPIKDDQIKSKITGILPPEVISAIVDLMISDIDKDKYISLLLVVGSDCIPGLLNFIANRGDINTRINVSTAIAAFSENAFSQIKPWLEDTRAHVLAGAVMSVGKIGSVKGLDLLLSVIDHPDLRIKREVIKALGMIRTIDSYEILMTFLKSKNVELKKAALISIGDLKIDAAIPDLIKFTKKGIFIRNDFEVRRAAIIALGRTRSVEAILPLLRIVRHNVLLRKKENDRLRLFAINAIGAIGGEEAVKVLEIGANSQNQKIKGECEKMLKSLASKMKAEEKEDA